MAVEEISASEHSRGSTVRHASPFSELARFNTTASIGFLREYLDYYLEQRDLWFDQADAMAALAHLDRLNGTHVLPEYEKRWSRFTKNKPNWDLSVKMKRFEDDCRALAEAATPGSNGHPFD